MESVTADRLSDTSMISARTRPAPVDLSVMRPVMRAGRCAWVAAPAVRTARRVGIIRARICLIYNSLAAPVVTVIIWRTCRAGYGGSGWLMVAQDGCDGP